ncbi:hypothetical protein [Deinococcus hopiensis]|uniref:hypothetical protein n=1 Tax=Deinococcus hopiensis TaxID=309885 RepID=UPI001BAEB568|nr:hypothetical protein [Deinococcus hopiensis]
MPLPDSGKGYASKIGNGRCKYHRPLEGTVKTATVKREGEKWYVVCACGVGGAAPTRYRGRGTDLGTNPIFLITSDGAPVKAPRHFKKAARKIGQFRRRVSKKNRGTVATGN